MVETFLMMDLEVLEVHLYVSRVALFSCMLLRDRVKAFLILSGMDRY